MSACGYSKAFDDDTIQNVVCSPRQIYTSFYFILRLINGIYLVIKYSAFNDYDGRRRTKAEMGVLLDCPVLFFATVL